MHVLGGCKFKLASKQAFYLLKCANVPLIISAKLVSHCGSLKKAEVDFRSFSIILVSVVVLNRFIEFFFFWQISVSFCGEQLAFHMSLDV